MSAFGIKRPSRRIIAMSAFDAAAAAKVSAGFRSQVSRGAPAVSPDRAGQLKPPFLKPSLVSYDLPELGFPKVPGRAQGSC
jgi:hypothetical protein